MTLCNENAPILVNEEMGCNIWLMTVRAPEIASTARPGQFVHVKVPGMEAHILRRPFGVYAADAEAGTVDMMYQVLGFGTEHMTELAIVDTVEMIGPIGRGWQPPEGCKRALLVAGGVGSAPLYPLVEELTAAGVAHPTPSSAPPPSTRWWPASATGPCSVRACLLHRRRHLRPRRLLHAACGRGPGGGRCGRRALRLRLPAAARDPS